MPATNHSIIKAALSAERVRLLLTQFDRLDDSLELNRSEVSCLLNRSISTLKLWASQPGHPIRWRQRGKQVATTVADVRNFLSSEQPRAKRGRPAKVTETAITT